MKERRVVISGTGALTAYGAGTDAFWQGISAGESAAAPIDAFDASPFPTRFAAPVTLSDARIDALIPNPKAIKTMSRAGRFITAAAAEAYEDSGLDASSVDPFRMGVSLGCGGLGLFDVDHAHRTLEVFLRSIDTSDGIRLDPPRAWRNLIDGFHPLTPLRALPNIPAAHVAINHNARGNCQTITTACTSSAQAIGEAFRQIRYGIADVMLAGGGDAMITPNGLASFCVLGVLSRRNDDHRRAARPFDRCRDGFMIGEGSAVFVLEELEHCLARGHVPYAEVLGYAATCDAYRLTDEPPEAWGAVAAMRQALADGDLHPAEVDYVNAHGTGTRMNDVIETHAMKEVFGPHARRMAVSSTKSMTGHLVAAAGAVELLACVEAIDHSCIPPTINHTEPDPECDLDYVPNDARARHLSVVMSNSFGFGGQNASLVIGAMNREATDAAQ